MMNILLRKLIRDNSKTLYVGTTIMISFMISIVLIQCIYVASIVFSGANNEPENTVIYLNKNQTSSEQIIKNTYNTTQALDNLYRSITVYSNKPYCQRKNLNLLIKKFHTLIHKCESIQLNKNLWLNTIYKSRYSFNYPIIFTFTAVVLVFLLMFGALLIQLSWRVPYLDFQRFAQEIGMHFQAKPLRYRDNIFSKQTAATFDFMQKRLNHIIEYQNKLLAMTCHDIRTPLARIQGRLLAGGSKLSQKDYEDISEINTMLDDLVLFSKENWIAGIATEKVWISDFFDNLIENYLEIGKDIRLINQLDEDLELEWKKPAIKRALINIINNGFKHGDKVIIKLTKSTNYNLQVEISDNGTGIPENEITQVFTPFYTGSSQKKGNGIGLTITRDIISAHNGQIKLFNLSKGGLNVKVLF